MLNRQNRTLIDSFKNAGIGILTTFKTQRNMQLHSSAACLTLALSWYLHITKTEWIWIILSIGLVFITEFLNTAIESVVDLKTQDFHPLAKRAKDCAAGAVLTASLLALTIATLVFLPYYKGIRWHHL